MRTWLCFVMLIITSAYTYAQYTEFKRVAASHRSFGSSVAGDESILAIGSQFEGVVFLYGKDVGGIDNWGLLKRIRANDSLTVTQFGTSVDIEGGRLVVGARDEASSGSAYVFEMDFGGPNNWGQVKKITPVDGSVRDEFGVSVALFNTAIVVGAPGDDDLGSSSGSAYVFEKDLGGADNWGLVKKLNAIGGGASDFFGSKVDVNENWVAVSAPVEGNRGRKGSVYLFERDSGGSNNWGQVKKISPFDLIQQQSFGASISMTDSLLAVGAPGSRISTDIIGSTYLFGKNIGGDGNWGQVTRISPSDGVVKGEFGRGVSIASEQLVVGAPYDNFGAVYVFLMNGGEDSGWRQVQKIEEREDSRTFGYSLSHWGSRLAVGSQSFSNSDVYIFEYEAPCFLEPIRVIGNDGGTASIDTSDLDLSSFGTYDEVYITRTIFTCDDMESSPVLDSIVGVSGTDTTICTFEVTVMDTVPPVITCMSDTLYMPESGSLIINPLPFTTSADNCSGWTVRSEPRTIDCSYLGDHTIDVIATDGSLNRDTCQAMITVLDTIRPELECSDITVYLDNMGAYILTSQDSTDMFGAPMDNCMVDSIYLSQSTFSCADMPEVTVTIEVYDQSDNVSSCEVTVTVMDTISPVLTCVDRTLDLPRNTLLYLVPEMMPESVYDNCEIDTAYLTVYNFDCSHVPLTPEQNKVTYTAVDASGNRSTCMIHVDVTDTHGYCCPDDLTVMGMAIDSTDYYASDTLFASGVVADSLPIRLHSTNVHIDSLNVDRGGQLEVRSEDCYEPLCPHPDYEALIAFYNATGGPNWTNNAGWADGLIGLNCTPCTWYGVGCDQAGRVRRIDMDGRPDDVAHGGSGGNNLQGILPEKIVQLTELQILILNDNPGIGSAIPSAIGGLPKLQRFNAANCSFSGSIPGAIGDSRSLARISLSGNDLTGDLPESMGQISTLQGLWLHNNNLTGTIPASFGNLSNLTSLWLDDNSMGGCFHADLKNLCPTLTNVKVNRSNAFDAAWSDFCDETAAPCNGQGN